MRIDNRFVMDFDYHTKIKLHMLAYYLTICAKVHTANPLKFTYFETHAGDGLVTLPDKTTVHGSALIAASSKIQYPCVLSEKKFYSELEFNIKKELRDMSHVKILPLDCNEQTDMILSSVPSYFHSLGFIDPTHPGELKWTTLEAICRHTHTYARGEVRRPEILLNFPIGRIKRNADWLRKTPENEQESTHRKTALDQNDAFFGSKFWRDIWEKDGDLVAYFIEKVAGFGYTGVLYTQVEEIRYHVPIYDMLLFVSQRKAEEVLPGMEKRLEKWRKEDYVREYYHVHDLAKWLPPE